MRKHRVFTSRKIIFVCLLFSAWCVVHYIFWDTSTNDAICQKFVEANKSIPGAVIHARAKIGSKALITGAAGFIGSHVAKDCAHLGFEVVAVDDLSGGFQKNLPEAVRFIVGDLKNATFVSELMATEKFDVVYHLAAYAAEGLSHFIRNYNYQNNLVATTNLITQSVRVGTVKKFVFTSSIAVYGSGRTPMIEDMQPLPEDPYGISKLACEYDLKAAYEMFGLKYVIFRPHNVYGPGQNMYDKYRNVVGIFLNQLQAGKQLTVFGDGSQTRRFSYISDVSFPIALSGILPHVENEIFNVGGDIATTVNELAQVTKEAWGDPEAVTIHLDARNEVKHAESDHQKLTCFFPGLPKAVGLREGMQQMVDWAKNVGKYFKPIAFDAVEVAKQMPHSWRTPGLLEVPAFTHDVHDNQIEHAEIPRSIRSTFPPEVFPESALKALFVFTMVRDDLLDLHLKSIDFPVEQVFVIQNDAKPDAVDAYQKVFKRYQGCYGGTQEGICVNPNIRNLNVLSSENNIGYAGSFNTGIKAMLELDTPYAIFSGDDTRFVPGRLKSAKQILESENACMYHFEGYSSFGITLNAVKLIGPMDENFWPIYSEDCDYWYRAQLAGCRLFYRGGYVPELPTPESKNNSFMEHGDIKHKSGSGSSTFKSDPLLAKLVTNTLHPSRGRFAYLKRKWGFDTCGLYHKVLNQWRVADEILTAMSYPELVDHGAMWSLPYNDTRSDIRHWDPKILPSPDAVSSRAVNSQWAPVLYVWQDSDYVKLLEK